MRFLLDTHVVLQVLRQTLARDHPGLARHLADASNTACVSVASLWEIAIKTKLGKLDPGIPLDELAGFLVESKLSILPIEATHVVATVEPEPKTRDPFDRLLLAQCQVEGLKLVTLDRALLGHRLASKF